jgi:hypothetical protein
MEQMQPVAYATGLCLAQLSDQARARQRITTQGSPRKGDQHGLWNVVDRHQYPHGRLHLCGRPDHLAGLMAHRSKLRIWHRGIGRFRVCTFQTLGHSTFRLASRHERPGGEPTQGHSPAQHRPKITRVLGCAHPDPAVASPSTPENRVSTHRWRRGSLF